MSRWILHLVSVSFALTSLSAFASSEESRGFEVASRSDQVNRGFGDSVVRVEMVLRDRQGKTTTRKLEIQTLENQGNSDLGDRSLIVFETPRDVEGTALLSHAKVLEDDDQWLFLPAVKRVKRISSANKAGAFVGSEFAFEDLTMTELMKFNYSWVKEEPCGEYTCDVIERTPQYKRSGYVRQLAWIDQIYHQTRKVEFYDRRNKLKKKLVLADYRAYGDIWRAHTMSMENIQTGKGTQMIYGTYQFHNGLSEGDFTKVVLSSLR